MSDLQGGAVNHRTGGSISGTHPTLLADDVVLAPTLTDEINTLKAAILPVACFRVEDLLFDFDSSFVLPEIQKHIPHLAALRQQHLDKRSGLFPPMGVFGHADPTGSDDYNKALSGRRAKAIYALLTRRTELWEELYSHPLGKDDWKTNGISTMLQATGGSADDDAVRQSKGSAEVRSLLFRVYMDQLCGNFKLQPVDGPGGQSDFLARGVDAKGKGDFQGCSDFNPVLIFSQQDQDKFSRDEDKTARNQANASNRRVMVFLFRPGAKVTPAHWPCPRADEGVGGCHARFWSDAEKRRHRREPDTPRTFDESRDTFACRFYDRMANDSPCERTVKVVTLTLRLMDGDDKPLANNRYRLQLGDKNTPDPDVINGVTNDNGILQQLIPAETVDAQLSVLPKTPAADPSSQQDPAGAGAGNPSAPAEEAPLWTIPLKIGPLNDPNTIAGAQARLNNLGLFASDDVDPTSTNKVGDPKTAEAEAETTVNQRLLRAIKRFQMLNKLFDRDQNATGAMDQQTIDKLKEKHGS